MINYIDPFTEDYPLKGVRAWLYDGDSLTSTNINTDVPWSGPERAKCVCMVTSRRCDSEGGIVTCLAAPACWCGYYMLQGQWRVSKLVDYWGKDALSQLIVGEVHAWGATSDVESGGIIRCEYMKIVKLYIPNNYFRSALDGRIDTKLQNRYKVPVEFCNIESKRLGVHTVSELQTVSATDHPQDQGQ